MNHCKYDQEKWFCFEIIILNPLFLKSKSYFCFSVRRYLRYERIAEIQFDSLYSTSTLIFHKMNYLSFQIIIAIVLFITMFYDRSNE